MFKITGNSGFTQQLCDAVKNHPKTALAAGAALASAAAYALDPALFALTKTDYGWMSHATSPTLLGRAVNLITLQPDETTYSASKFYQYYSTGICYVGGGLVGALLTMGTGSYPLIWLASSFGSMAGGFAQGKYIGLH